MSLSADRLGPPRKANERGLFLALAIITLIAVVIRWIGAQQSLFGDELYSYVEVTPPSLGGVFDQIDLWENSPPVYHVLAWLSGKLGDPTVSIRLPSVIASAAAVPVVYLIGDAIGGRRSGLIAAALFAVLPYAIFYGSEARPYGLVFFLVPVSTLGLLNALAGRGRAWWILFCVAGTLALYTHYTAGVALAAQAIWALLTQPRRRRAVLTANAVVIVAFLPWVPMLDNNTNVLWTLEALHPLNLTNILVDPLRLIFGHPYAPFDQVPGPLSLIAVGLAVAVIVVARVRPSMGPGGEEKASPWDRGGSLALPHLGWLLMSMTGGVVALTLVYSAVSEASIYQSHHMLTVVPYFCLLAGVAAAVPQRRLALLAGSALVFAAFLGSMRMLEQYPQPNLKGAAEVIADRAAPGTPVVEPWRFGHAPNDLRFDPLQQGLAIYLDDQFPLHHPADVSQWPRGREVYVVQGSTFGEGGMDFLARSAGAQLIESIRFDGFLEVTLHRYSAVGAPDV